VVINGVKELITICTQVLKRHDVEMAQLTGTRGSLIGSSGRWVIGGRNAR